MGEEAPYCLVVLSPIRYGANVALPYASHEQRCKVLLGCLSFRTDVFDNTHCIVIILLSIYQLRTFIFTI